MPPEVITAAVTQAGSVIGAILALVGSIYAIRASHHAKRGRGAAEAAHVNAHAANANATAARRQVQNSHETNLRDDVDGLRDQLLDLSTNVNAGLEAIWLEIKGPPTAPTRLPDGHSQ